MSATTTNNQIEDPFPVPFEWAEDDVFNFGNERFIYDESEWAPQVNGTAISIYGED